MIPPDTLELGAPGFYTDSIGEYTTNNGILIYEAYNSTNPTITLGNASDGTGINFNTNLKFVAPSTDNNWTLGTTYDRWNGISIGTGNATFAGSVGIGTTSPGALLEIRGTSAI